MQDADDRGHDRRDDDREGRQDTGPRPEEGRAARDDRFGYAGGEPLSYYDDAGRKISRREWERLVRTSAEASAEASADSESRGPGA